MLERGSVWACELAWITFARQDKRRIDLSGGMNTDFLSRMPPYLLVGRHIINYGRRDGEIAE